MFYFNFWMRSFVPRFFFVGEGAFLRWVPRFPAVLQDYIHQYYDLWCYYNFYSFDAKITHLEFHWIYCKFRCFTYRMS